VRALLLFPPTAKEIPSEVKVLVDGKVVARVEIDPDDPFMSAVALRQLEITGHLSKGDNQVKVVYDGKLKAPVKLTVHKWSKPEKKSMAVPGAPAITVGREVADVSDGAGRLFAVDIVVDFEKDSVPVMVTEPIPSNAGVDVTSLDALIAKGVILGYDLESDRVVFYPTPGEGDLHIVYRLEGERRGKAIHAGTTVAPLSDPDLAVCGKPGRLVVD